MRDDGYRGDANPEDRWGCVVAAIVGIPVFIFLLLVDALGHCAPDTTCEKGFLTQVLLPSIASAVVSGLIVWWLVKRANTDD